MNGQPGSGGIFPGLLAAGVSGLLVLGGFLLAFTEGQYGPPVVASPTAAAGTELALLPPLATFTPVLPSESPTLFPSETATPLPTSTNTPVVASPATSAECPPAPDDWEPYETKHGENLRKIAENFGTTPEELTEVNCLNGSPVEPGEFLYVPPQPTEVTCGRLPGWNYIYYVQRGDTLLNISHRAGASVRDIMTANCLSSDNIRAGQTLFLPRSIPPVPPIPTALPRHPTNTPVPLPTETAPPPPPTSTPDGVQYKKTPTPSPGP